jgi:hypothetical protein
VESLPTLRALLTVFEVMVRCSALEEDAVGGG